MEISHYEDHHVYVVSLSGDLSGPQIVEANTYLKALIDQMDSHKIQGLVLDFSEVTRIDSAGVGVIGGKCVRLKQANRNVAICNVSREVLGILTVSGLDQALPFFGSVPDAVNRFAITEQKIVTWSDAKHALAS